MAKLSAIQEEIQNTLRTEVRNVIKCESDVIKKQLEELKKTSPYDVTPINDLKTELKRVQCENNELRTKITEMTKTVSQLNASINALDLSMREANLEIYGLPDSKTLKLADSKTPKLPAIIVKLATVVSYTLKDSDILKCVRVPNNMIHPYSVVVKLRSVRCRDELFAAVVRYNQSHPDNKLNTSVLGYPGKKQPVYVTEHRSPMYKS